MRYVDREDAGRALAGPIAAALGEAGVTSKPLVLGIPRGGVAVAAPLANQLGAELNVVLARKVGAPGNPELALGAVGERGETVLIEDVISGLGVGAEVLQTAIEEAQRELERRLAVYRRARPAPEIAGRVVVVVDDGVATGATFRATLETVRHLDPSLLVGAVPVGPVETTSALARIADIFVCPQRPRRFRAVSEWYDRFDQVSEEQVVELLRSG